MSDTPLTSKKKVEAVVEWLAHNATGMTLTDWSDKSRTLLAAADEIERLQNDKARLAREAHSWSLALQEVLKNKGMPTVEPSSCNCGCMSVEYSDHGLKCPFYLAGKCERLEKEITRITRGDVSNIITTLGDALTYIGQLERARATQPPDVLRDAERYRALRKGNDYDRLGAMVVLCEQEHIDSDDRPFWSIADEVLDKHADAAVAAATKSGVETPACETCGDETCSGYHAELR